MYSQSSDQSFAGNRYNEEVILWFPQKKLRFLSVGSNLAEQELKSLLNGRRIPHCPILDPVTHYIADKLEGAYLLFPRTDQGTYPEWMLSTDTGKYGGITDCGFVVPHIASPPNISHVVDCLVNTSPRPRDHPERRTQRRYGVPLQ